MDSEVSKAILLYKEIVKTPVVTSACILPSTSEKHFNVYSNWSVQDLVSQKKTTFDRVHCIEKTDHNIVSSGICSKPSAQAFQSISRSGLKQAVLVVTKNPDETFLEIWSSTRKEVTINLTNQEEHGKVHTLDMFGCLKFSSDEKFLLYIAEKKQPKGVSFFKDTKTKEEEELVGKGKEYLYREEWGEGFPDYHHCVLCILEIETEKVQVLPIDSLMDTEVSVSQAEWGPGDESIVFVAWDELPYRLGIWSCMNRRSSLCSFNLKTKQIEYLRKEDNICVYSPRFSPNLDALVFMENESGGPHKKGAKLQKIEWKTKKLSTVIDIIHNPVGNAFPGLYTYNFPKRCWSSDGNNLIFSTEWRSKTAAVSVNVNDGSVRKIGGETYGNFNVLDVHNNIVIASADSPNVEPCLLIGCLNEDSLVKEWKSLDKDAPRHIPDVKWDIHTICPPDQNPEFPNLDYEVIVISPAETKKENPLILLPHGGPHSCIPAFYSYKILAFIKLGYIVCMVNYRGSVGFGENNLNSLPGNVGSQDVADVHNAAIYVKEKCNFDIGDIFLYGGSHGGFLGAHLTGQYPQFYKAAVLRNPVIDISAMINISDIPDWCWVESGCGTQMKPNKVMKPEQLKIMWEKSPIRYAENVITPTLLLLGKEDVRVPMAQGMKYYKFLKANKVPVEVFLYDDNHILSKTPVDGDGFIQTISWLKKYSSKEN